MNDLHYWDDFLSQEQFEFVEKEMENHNWTFIGKGYEGTDKPIRTFWFKDLSKSQTLIDFFKEKVESVLNVRIVPQRFYANGQAHGQSAFIHADKEDVENNDGTYCSLVYYIHRNWKPEYGGHLMIIDDSETKVLHSVFPKTNSAVIFNSYVKHMALEPSVYCRDQRVSIAFKFRIIK